MRMVAGYEGGKALAVIKYSEKVLEHFRNPKNIGMIEDADGQSTVGSPACGDQVSMFLKIREDRITDIKFYPTDALPTSRRDPLLRRWQKERH